ncbi:uncharacterized protein Hap1MRO34_005816 isoform 2-T4 [Clarias gariepinus]|nr:uncharacterized protein LOC128520971 isoform X2 [Clarias gariepinus]XP_053351419.1 uncharacterized protein LOC128520971 isoform X2 [Clarias gariepinus]XP_053351420.1 uncharacterized protein LOC128520971 isoform X2 [Clarias gariepinus]
MDTKDPSLQDNTEMQSTSAQDFPHYQETSVACKNETYTEDVFVPCSSDRNNLHNRCPSPPESIIIAEMMSVKTARHRVQAPAYYSANRGQDYALEPECGISIGVSDPIYQNFSLNAATGDMSALQICSPTVSLPQGVATASSPSPLHSSQKLPEEASRKRELRLIKNREAARECRRKKKEYVRCLENRVAVLEKQNKTLIEELKALKDLYCHKTE